MSQDRWDDDEQSDLDGRTEPGGTNWSQAAGRIESELGDGPATQATPAIGNAWQQQQQQPQTGPATVAMQSILHPSEAMGSEPTRPAGGTGPSTPPPGVIDKLQKVATHGIGNYVRNFLPHLLRVFAGNLSTNLASPHERAWLRDRAGVHTDAGQTFLVWRRSAMVLMVVPLAVTAVVSVIAGIVDILALNEQTDVLRDALATSELGQSLVPGSVEALETMFDDVYGPLVLGFTLVKGVSILATVVSVVLAMLAVRHWTHYQKSRRLLMAGWSIGFVLPFLVSLLPMRLLLGDVDAPTLVMLDGTTVPPAALETLLGQLEIQIGLAFGLYMFILLAPTVLTLFPAMIRASLYTKTLVPQSPVPGWITVVVPVFYAMVTFAFFALLNQLAGDVLMLLAVFFMLLSPMAYLLQARKLTAPMAAGEVFPAVRKARLLSLFVAIVAAFLVVAWVQESRILEELELVTPLGLTQAMFDFVAKYLITTLVGCDLLVRILVSLRKRAQEDEIHGAILASELTHRLDELVELDVDEGPTPAAAARG